MVRLDFNASIITMFIVDIHNNSYISDIINGTADT